MWINNHKRELEGAPLAMYGSENQTTKTRERNDIESSLKKAVGDDQYAHASSVIKILFPRAADLLGNHTEAITSDELLRLGRVASKHCFDLVFNYALDDLKITRDGVLEMLSTWDADALASKIREYAGSGVLPEFTSLLSAASSEISEDRYPQIIEAMLRSQGRLNEGTRGFLKVSTADRIWHVLENMMAEVGQEKTAAVLRRTLPKLDLDALMSFGTFLNTLEIDRGRYGSSTKPKERCLISVESCEEIETTYLTRLEKESEKKNLLERPDAFVSLFVWRKLQDKQCCCYIKKSLASSDKAIAIFFTCEFGQAFNGNGGMSWTVKISETYGLSDAEIVNAIERYARTNDFGYLMREDQEKIATLDLVLRNPEYKDEGTVPLSLAIKQIEEWTSATVSSARSLG